MAEFKCASLPPYTPSEPSPSYSCALVRGECSLQRTPRQTASAPTGSYTKKCGNIAITLFEQEHGVDMPTYGRRGYINGAIYLECLHSVSHLVVKVEGKLDTMISEGGSKSITLLNHSLTLWRRGAANQLSNLLPFSYSLPSTFTYSDSESALPPSYNASHPGFPAFFIRIQYSITVVVTRVRRNLEFLAKVDDVKVPFRYHPRTRAHRPIIASPSFLSTVKASPEEWYQAFTAMKTRRPSEMEPIHFHLFIPSARVYGLTDKIPFHVQLNGPLDSLQKLLMPQPADAPPPPSWTAKESSEKCPLHAIPKIRVYVLRKSHIETRGREVFRNITIGDGEIWEIPPAICETRGDVHLDWEGELRIQPNVTVGGFFAGNVSVKDFIALSVEPPTVDNQPLLFLPLQLTVPIRLVTNPWVDVSYHGSPPAV